MKAPVYKAHLARTTVATYYGLAARRIFYLYRLKADLKFPTTYHTHTIFLTNKGILYSSSFLTNEINTTF